VVLIVLVVLFVAAGPAGASPAPSPAPSTEATPAATSAVDAAGDPAAEVFAENCSGCHGSRGEGGFGPPLAAAGFAELVAPMVEQGGIQMPAFGDQLSEAQIQAVAEYVAASVADPAARTAVVADGGQIYRLYCAGCHSATGRGGALTRGRNAPDISQYPAAEALAAMILGRGNMPAFAGNTLDVRQQAAVGLYVNVLVDPPSPGGRGLGYLGPVTEGAVSALALLILIFLAVWLAWKSRTAAP
jgi:ubiquinol-cytochrome c reductase cytochrome c subunit